MTRGADGRASIRRRVDAPRSAESAGTLRNEDSVELTQASAAGRVRADSVSRLRLLASHGPYYWRLLKSLPYGAARRLTRSKCRDYSLMEPFFRDKYGLEIGGPSPIFCGNKLIPVYGRCRKMDNLNFSSHTIWNLPGQNPEPGFAFARQYVAEASDLSQVPDETYDFVLASHVLEHVANPLRALQEWKRVLSPQGTMLVIVPDRRGTFDHRRAPTTFEHIEADFRNSTTEADLTHLDEILALHDIALDPGAGSAQQFRERCLNNAAVRALHHHVFVPEVVVRMFSRVQMRVLSVAIERPFHIIVFAQRVDAAESNDVEGQNINFIEEAAEWRQHDPLGKTGDGGAKSSPRNVAAS
jgi:SAM-dependent methyltransferase